MTFLKGSKYLISLKLKTIMLLSIFFFNTNLFFGWLNIVSYKY